LPVPLSLAALTKSSLVIKNTPIENKNTSCESRLEAALRQKQNWLLWEIFRLPYPDGQILGPNLQIAGIRCV
jgi:hypothetical protein